MKVDRCTLPTAGAAVETLGSMIAAGRRERGWTAAALADRLGVSLPTLRRVERGEPSVAIGVMFDAAVLCGVELFSTPPERLPQLARDSRLRLALLPERVRQRPVAVDDDF